MSLLDKFKDQFVDRDDEDMEEEDLGEETAPVNPAQPVPPRPAAVRGIGRSAVPRQAAKPYTMVVVSPKSYSDAEKIGDHLKAMRPVVMNMEKTDADEAQRIELGRVLHYSQIAPRVSFYGKTPEGVMAAFDAAVEYVAEAPKIRFTCTDPDDQHFLDLASLHKAVLVSKDRAVLKQRKRVATHYGATVGNMVLLEEMATEAL